MHTPVSSVSAEGCVNVAEGGDKQGVLDHKQGAGGGEVLQEGGDQCKEQ